MSMCQIVGYIVQKYVFNYMIYQNNGLPETNLSEFEINIYVIAQCVLDAIVNTCIHHLNDAHVGSC